MNKYEILKELKSMYEEFGEGVEEMNAKTKSTLYSFLLDSIQTLINEIEGGKVEW